MKICQIPGKAHRFKVAPDPDILEKAHQCRVVHLTGRLMSDGIREPIQREDNSFCTAECYFAR